MKLPQGVPEHQQERVEERAKRFNVGLLSLRNLKLWLRLDLGWSMEQIDEFVKVNEYRE